MKSLINYFILISILLVVIKCNNTTDKFNTMKTTEFQSRQNRLVSFNTQDNGDINLELEFNVPFITIPVKRSFDMAKGAIANVNIGAIILSGAIFLGFGVIIPWLLVIMSKKSFSPFSHSNYKRHDSQFWDYLNIFDQVLTENHFDTTSCMQRIVCWAVQTSSENVQKGSSSSSDKIIDGLATNKWMQQIIEGTVIYSALQNGLNNSNCEQTYHQCKLDGRTIQLLTKSISNNILGN